MIKKKEQMILQKYKERERRAEKLERNMDKLEFDDFWGQVV